MSAIHRALILIGAIFLFAVAAIEFVAVTSRAPTPAAHVSPRLGPGEWLATRRLYASQYEPGEAAKITAHYQALRARTPQRSAASANALWTFVGPVNIGGRVLDIAVDPLLADTLYVASASGGVWQSTDAATTFTSVWPDSNAQPIGALAIDSNATLYAGTGESGPGGGSPTYGNAGVFKSTDRGATWVSSGLVQSERISRIVIDPGNEQRLFVAATGPLYAPGGQRGVYRSDDGGGSWTLVLAGANATTGASDVFVSPTNSDRVYAVLWDHLREPALRRYGGVGSGIFRSLDGGDSWVRLGGGLPAAASNVGRIALGVAPSNPNRLYATYLDDIGFFTAFYTSTDGGDTWTALPFNQNLSDSQSIFGWWFARLWVDPVLETRVFSAGISLLLSTDGGASFGVDQSVHADQHAMAWDPAVAGRIYLGNDGGVYRSDTNGTGAWSFAVVQPFTQFYTLDVGEQNPQRLVGGTQDNRCLRSYSQGNASDWNSWGCGDGLENLINPVDQNLLYGCSQYGNCQRSLDGGETAFPIGATVSSRRNWMTPLVFDPNDPGVMYYAGDRVNRSVDGGASWSVLSGDLTGGDPFPSPIDFYPFGTVSTLAVARTDSNVLYVGTDDARIWYTRDLGVTWTQSLDPILPDRWVSKIVVSPTDAMQAFAAYSGFRNADDAAYLFMTTDGGVTWTDITGNLPAAPVNTLATAPDNGLIVGNDVGVFSSFDSGATWDVLGQGLPQVPVTDLRVHEPSATLFASTFGRGIYSVMLPAMDSDADGIANGLDNCITIANPAQADSDGDLYGNACDADFNNDCEVNVQDLGEMRVNFFQIAPEFDLTADGIVNVLDLARLKSLFFQPVGPSGLTALCAP